LAGLKDSFFSPAYFYALFISGAPSDFGVFSFFVADTGILAYAKGLHSNSVRIWR